MSVYSVCETIEPLKKVPSLSFTVSAEERVREYVMLGLRLESGISADEYCELSGREMYDDMPKMRRFIDAGFLLEKNGRICFSDKGFFVSNAILSELLY